MISNITKYNAGFNIYELYSDILSEKYYHFYGTSHIFMIAFIVSRVIPTDMND